MDVTQELIDKHVVSIRSQLAGFDEAQKGDTAADVAMRQKIKLNRDYGIRRDVVAALAAKRSDALKELPSIRVALAAPASYFAEINGMEFIALAEAVAEPSEPVKPPRGKVPLTGPTTSDDGSSGVSQ